MTDELRLAAVVGLDDVKLLVATGVHRERWVAGGGPEAQAGAIAVRGVAAVVEDVEQIAPVLDRQAAGVAAGRLGVAGGEVAAGAERVGRRRGGRARRGRARAGAAG